MTDIFDGAPGLSRNDPWREVAPRDLTPAYAPLPALRVAPGHEIDNVEVVVPIPADTVEVVEAAPEPVAVYPPGLNMERVKWEFPFPPPPISPR